MRNKKLQSRNKRACEALRNDVKFKLSVIDMTSCGFSPVAVAETLNVSLNDVVRTLKDPEVEIRIDEFRRILFKDTFQRAQSITNAAMDVILSTLNDKTANVNFRLRAAELALEKLGQTKNRADNDGTSVQTDRMLTIEEIRATLNSIDPDLISDTVDYKTERINNQENESEEESVQDDNI